MRSQLIEILRCPSCSGKLRAAISGESGNVREGTLTCEACAAEFRIEDGIALLPPPHLSAFKQGEIEGWRNLSEDAELAAEDFDWRDLPYVKNPQGEPPDAHWAQAAISFPVAMALMAPLAGKRVLEIGSSAGWACRRFSDAGAEAIGIDLGLDFLRTSERFIKLGSYFDRMFADGENLPFADASFDHVFCCSVVHHFEDPARLLREAARALKPGGSFIAINEAYRPLLSRGEAALRSSEQTSAHLDAGIHEQIFTHAQYRGFIEGAGLQFKAVHPRWDAAGEPLRAERNRGLRSASFEISDAERSALRRAANAIGVQRWLAKSEAISGAAREILFRFTRSYRVLVGRKPE